MDRDTACSQKAKQDKPLAEAMCQIAKAETGVFFLSQKRTLWY
ncbi:hypothetical protein [uncultured Microbulbifer sp.]|nr:hypothetical protein [uncultured Microbulbifer sp.]